MRIQQGDRLAFQKLFDLLWKPLYIYAQSVVMDEEAAKDLVQEVWIDYWKRCKKIQNLARLLLLITPCDCSVVRLR